MNKRIKDKVAKRRANSPRMVELRRWLLELATAKHELDTARATAFHNNSRLLMLGKLEKGYKPKPL